MKPRARTEKQADDAAGFEQGTFGRVTLSMGVAVAQEVESLEKLPERGRAAVEVAPADPVAQVPIRQGS
jgi:hypothetical protein